MIDKFRDNMNHPSWNRHFPFNSGHIILSLFIVSVVFFGCENDTVNSGNTSLFVVQNLSAVIIDDRSALIEWHVDPLPSGLEFLLQRSENNEESWLDIIVLHNAPFSFTDTSLSEGNFYAYQLFTISENDTSEPSNPVSIVTPPRSPSNLELLSIAGSTVTITWLDNSDIETGYEVYRRQGLNSEYDYELLLPPNSTTLIDTGLLSNNRYYYHVRSITESLKSPWSDEIITATNPVPSNLVAEVRSDSVVWLGWRDYSEYETGFRLERFHSGIIDTEITVNRNTTSYIDMDVYEGETFEYQLRVLYNEAFSPPSERITVFTPPSSPANLSVIQDVDIDTAAYLSWDDVSSVETGYEIQRKKQYCPDFETITILRNNATDFRDTGLEPYLWYYYKVRTLLDTFSSDWTNPDSMYSMVLIPLRPTALSVEALAATQIRLDWIDNAINEDGYVIESILPQGDNWTCLDTLPENDRLYYKGGLTPESSYSFRVYAYNEIGNSPFSNQVSVTTPVELPDTPTNLHEIEVTYSSVSLSWQDNSYNETGFRIERCMHSLYQWELIGLTNENTATFIDSTVDFNETYRYRVAAYNEAGVSSWSRELVVNVPDGPPGAPLHLRSNPINWNSIHLTWMRSTNNETGYNIARMSEFEDDFSLIAETGHGEVVYNDTNLLDQTSYYYRVRAFNDFGVSDWSNIDSTKTQPNRAFWDNFESYSIGSPPDRYDWSQRRAGSSFAAVTDRDAYQSSKSLLFYDPANSEGSYAMLCAEHEAVRDGRFECFLKICDNGYFNIQGGDERKHITFQIQFNADNTFDFQNGDNLDSVDGYPVDEWFRLSVAFNVENREYSISFNEEYIVENAALMRDDHDGNCRILFMTLTDNDLDRAYIDDVSVIIVSE